MEDFDTFVATRGEVIAQAILENWERCQKIRHTTLLPLEDRWAFFIRTTEACVRSVAA